MFRWIAVLALLATGPAMAESFEPVKSERDFRALVQGKTLVLTRPGLLRPIQLVVEPGGDLSGAARGYQVSGFWRWEGSRFCREMDWGGYTVQYSCQDVSLNGNELRFIADRGMFRTAYFRIQ